jgi:amino acid adenylation domain-containing protein
MTQGTALHEYLERSARRTPDRVAVEEAGADALTYAELDALADRLAAYLATLGVGPGHRVGVGLHKSIDSMASLFGILKSGAAYVPVDPAAPPPRSAGIFADAAVRALVAEASLARALEPELEAAGHVPLVLALDGVGGGRSLAAALDAAGVPGAAAKPARTPDPDDLAYILFTSGSTGRPKGVTLTHRNAISFVDWVVRTFAPAPDDRFSSHAPFHFDLSVLDLYASMAAGATVVLIGEDLGKDPVKLAAFMAGKRLTIWYSTPSVLSLMVQYGHLDQHDLSALRVVFFAGEVFPVRHLRRLTEILPGRRYVNLYGPTETNVCTWHEIPLPIPADRDRPYPIGAVCDHLASRVVDETGAPLSTGEPGELVIAGPAVTGGYWNLPDRNAAAYFRDADGTAWYRTGDIVTDPGDGVFEFLGRRDRMVKRRGYRVELGEIEAALYRHPAIHEAAVVARQDAEAGVTLTAFVVFRDGQKASIIEMKRFSSQALLASMIPDVFKPLPALPKTSTDKIDYQKLAEMT